MPGLKTPRRSSLARRTQLQPPIRYDYRLNLSISVSRGKESNSDPLSSGERSGVSPNLEAGSNVRVVIWRCLAGVELMMQVLLERSAIEGDSPVPSSIQSHLVIRHGVVVFGNALLIWR